VKAQSFIGKSARLTITRYRSSWWGRLIDWMWPPVLRYGRRGILTLTVNGNNVFAYSLRHADYDRKGKCLVVGLVGDIGIGPHDPFSAQITFDHSRSMPVTFSFTLALDGFLIRPVAPSGPEGT
jgi:hypothetical protein